MAGYSVGDMIDEAWLDAAGRYTVDFGGSNFSRIADMAAEDWAEKHPDLIGFQSFVAGGVFEKLRAFQREVMKNREGN